MLFKIVLVLELINLKKDILFSIIFELYKVFGVINVNFINLDVYYGVCRFIWLIFLFMNGIKGWYCELVGIF